MKKIPLILIFVSLVLGGMVTWWVSIDSRYKNLVDACKRLQLGDTEERVYDLMGLPERTKAIERDGRKMQILKYPGPSIESTLPEIFIDLELHRVERIICNDTYTLIAKNQQ